MDNTSIKNSYPEKPVFGLSWKKVTAKEIADYIISTDFPSEVKQATLAIKAAESGWDASVFNNNMFGIQADVGKWGQPWDNLVIGTVIAKQNSDGKLRRFCVFADWKSSVNFQLATILRRQMYIGGLPWKISKFFISDETSFAKAYIQEWVDGDKSGKSFSQKKVTDTINIYRHAGVLLGKSITTAAEAGVDEKKIVTPYLTPLAITVLASVIILGFYFLVSKKIIKL